MQTQKLEGDELNAEVAVRVMGWPIYIDERDGNPDGKPGPWVYRYTYKGKLYWTVVTPKGDLDWRPSTDPAHALLIVDPMRAKGFYFGASLDYLPDKKWAVGFSPNGNLDRESESLPEAICLAALASLHALEQGSEGEGK